MEKMKKHNFNVVTSGLTEWINENDKELLIQMQITSDLAPYAEIKTCLKEAIQNVHFMDTTVTWQSDACSYNASDSTTLTEKPIQVGQIAAMEDICPKLFWGFWAEQLMKKGSANDADIPAEISRAWTELKLNINKKQINVADWQGDTASGNANLNKYNGLIKEIFNDASVIDGNTSDAATATTESNILARMKEMYMVITEEMAGDDPEGGNLIWFLPYTYKKMYNEALKAANLYHFVGGQLDTPTVDYYYGTKIELKTQIGLAGQDKMVIMRKGDILLGMDGETDEDQLEVWYSKDDQTNHSKLAFKRGITYKFSDYIVKWGLGTS
jgi:hypothetical protein